MARPRRCRRICMEPAYDRFTPGGISSSENVLLTFDEYEAIRLIDFEKRTHEQCAAQMDISRTTVTEIYEAARYKIADGLINGKTLLITGGHYRLCDGSASSCCHGYCRRTVYSPENTQPEMKGTNQMRIAVPYENGQVFQHFGHTEQFKLYDVENGQIVNSQVVNTNGQGHGALAWFLTQAKADALICGGIGGGAQAALAEAGIQLFGGVSGSADEAVRAYLDGTLGYDPNVRCSHHEHEHSCHEDKHGCGGNGGRCHE